MEGYEPVSNTAFGSIASQDSQRRADARRRARPDDYVVVNDAMLSRFPAVLHQVKQCPFPQVKAAQFWAAGARCLPEL